MTIFEIVQEHAKATDSTDRDMVLVLCGFIETLSKHDQRALPDFMVDSLSRLPGDFGELAEGLPRYDDRFTELDKQNMWEGALDEGSDLDRKEIAELVLDSWDIVSCIAACTVIRGEHKCEELAHVLQHLSGKLETGHVNGEFLRAHDDDGDGYAELLDFAKRMGLIDETENELTDIGTEYMDSLI